MNTGDGFLRPSAETQRDLKAKRDARELETKRKKKVQAAERKAKRDQEKARVAEIEAELLGTGSNTKKASQPIAMTQEDLEAQSRDVFIAEYLDSPPFFGSGAYEV